MTSDGQSQLQESDKAPESPEERAYVARKKAGAHKKCLDGEKVWLTHPDGTGPYAAVVEEAQFIDSTKRMKYRLKYEGEVLSHKDGVWFAQEYVNKE
ncbi:hypothetical protein LTR27_004941 [Elasticomyces elasticus]|nr:hypothetical protein LTR27_004941 [Elasticomyces elasticus]